MYCYFVFLSTSKSRSWSKWAAGVCCVTWFWWCHTALGSSVLEKEAVYFPLWVRFLYSQFRLNSLKVPAFSHTRLGKTLLTLQALSVCLRDDAWHSGTTVIWSPGRILLKLATAGSLGNTWWWGGRGRGRGRGGGQWQWRWLQQWLTIFISVCIVVMIVSFFFWGGGVAAFCSVIFPLIKSVQKKNHCLS